MEMDVLLVLLAVSLMASMVDAMAGGGGLLTVPTLLWCGFSPQQTLATNKAQSVVGACLAAHYYWSKGLFKFRKSVPLALLAGLGGLLGSFWVQSIDAAVLEKVIPYLLIGFAAYFALSPQVGDEDRHQRMRLVPFALTFAMAIGVYDGVFGPGTGAFYTIACVSMLGHNLLRATAHAKLCNAFSNSGALIAFIIGGHVVWEAALVMILGQLVGARLGASLAHTHGSALIKPLLVVMTLLMSGKLILEQVMA